MLNRTYKYKIEPKKSQVKELNKFVGSCRYVYNFFLHFNMNHYEKNNKTLLVPEMLKLLTPLKAKKPFLNNVPYQILESTLITLKSDINNSLKLKKPFPPFRQKGKDDFFTLIRDFNVSEKQLSIPGIEMINYRNSRYTNEKIKSVKISKVNDSWVLHLLITKNKANSTVTNKRYIGIDVGLKDFAILSNGKKVSNPQFYRRLETKLIFEQRKLDRKVMGSNSWLQQKKRIQKIHNRIYNARMNFLHKVSTYIIQHYDVIGVENLNIQVMSSNRKLAKSVMDASWGTFVVLLKYKAAEHSKHVIEVSRFYPSSQLCSSCGSKQLMPLHLRTFICKSCDHKVDRDYNASLNIEKKAREIFEKNIKGIQL